MSTYTNVWTEEKIRHIIGKLDEKTGLNGAELPIKFENRKSRLGVYHHGKNPHFGFNRSFLNDPNTWESEAVGMIRHEYAHYYQFVAQLSKYVPAQFPHHGDDWKYACARVNAVPRRVHDPSAYSHWSYSEAQAAYRAEDVEFFDVLSFIRDWNDVPFEKDPDLHISPQIRSYYSNDVFFKIGDTVLHPENGFGMVEYTTDIDSWSQKIFVLFENGVKDIFYISVDTYDHRPVCKVVNGVVNARKKRAGRYEKATGKEFLQ